MKNFALIGAAGYIAPRHLKAIHETNNRLVAALDPHDSVGILDQYFPDASFFTEFERFDRHLEKLRRQSEAEQVHYISICSPNYLHDAHIRAALRVKAQAICEKPLVINPWNLDSLAALEAENNCRVYTVLQLRLNPSVVRFKKELAQHNLVKKVDVVLTYITRRGRWYDVSWKGNSEKSGGLGTNIGIHLFDLMIWLFGKVENCGVHLMKTDKMAGLLDLEKARVRWFLSVDSNDLPQAVRQSGRYAYRSLSMEGTEIELSDNFTDLHTRVYQDILAGNGFGIEDARPSIQTAYDIRHATSSIPKPNDVHPFLR